MGIQDTERDGRVVRGLGWPLEATADGAIGYPRVSRETLTWPSTPPHLTGAGSRSPALRGSPEASPVGEEPGTPSSPTVDSGTSANVSGARPVPEGPPAGPAAYARSPGPAADERSGAASAAARLDQGTDRGVSTAQAQVTALPRPTGPRRARFDQDETPLPPVPEPDRDDSRVSRETHAPPVFPAPAQSRIFVVANQKGGVGKTTSAVNLAAALAMGGLRVLLIDLDPQGNASTALGIDHPAGTPGTYDVIIQGDQLADHAQVSPEAQGLTVLPATIDLAGAEIELVSMVARENRLSRALAAYLDDHPVDYVFLDCPPSLGLLTLNALVAATEILIPIQCEYYALEGVSQLMRTIDLVKGELNDDLAVSTVLLTMFDGRTKLAAQVADEVRSHFPEQTLPTMIPRSVRISEAPSYAQTVLTYHPDSAGAVSYLAAAQEIARRGAKEIG